MPSIKPPFPRVQKGKLFADRLIGYWPFYEGGGVGINDISGNEADGVYTNPAAGDWVGSPVGWAAEFDGVNQYVDLDAHAAKYVSLDTLTLAVWVIRESEPAREVIAGFSESTASSTDWGLTPAIGIAEWFVRDGGPSLHVRHPMPAGILHCVIMSGSPNGNKFFVNGILATDYIVGNATTAAGPSEAPGMDSFRFANRVDSGGNELEMTGQILAVAAWNRTMEQPEAAALYSMPFASVQPPTPSPGTFVQRPALSTSTGLSMGIQI